MVLILVSVRFVHIPPFQLLIRWAAHLKACAFSGSERCRYPKLRRINLRSVVSQVTRALKVRFRRDINRLSSSSCSSSRSHVGLAPRHTCTIRHNFAALAMISSKTQSYISHVSTILDTVGLRVMGFVLHNSLLNFVFPRI